MTLVLTIAGVLLAGSAVLATIRIIRGPSPVDRVVATDVLIAIVVGALAIEAAVSRHSYTVPVMLALALLAFAGTVAMARFVAGRPGVVESDSVEATDHSDEVEDER